ncbi:MAG: hypothetical protein U0Q03_24170 [Acidimicrobiales bacterium]
MATDRRFFVGVTVIFAVTPESRDSELLEPDPFGPLDPLEPASEVAATVGPATIAIDTTTARSPPARRMPRPSDRRHTRRHVRRNV